MAPTTAAVLSTLIPRVEWRIGRAAHRPLQPVRPQATPRHRTHYEGTHMPAKTTDIADEELEPVADETANSARRVVAAYATDADECRMLLAMLGIAPGENA
ncbi:hypothetical protein GOAMI_14_01940 [Gordonia amicalis NBRC 100051 = JCM 11271]|nr:hypothetical protein CNO18_03250 [Gordonia sp. 1D]GAC52806.1 hypothetical protein GOAMI_14_01940 [Gordonia amicalis NBRC 100051 = JCM 11271]